MKLLYNAYKEGNLKIMKDGLVTMKNNEPSGHTTQAISVPTVLYPGLVHAIHRKLNHPSKSQLFKLMSRHYYTPGHQRIINEVTEACDLCAAMKTLPKEFLSESTGEVTGLATQFSADVIERGRQAILIIREKLSSFVFATIIPDQTAETLMEAVITSIASFIPNSGTTIQVDAATAWNKLHTSQSEPNSLLAKLGIRI